MKVRDVKTKEVKAVAPDTDLMDVAVLLVQKCISGARVGGGGRVLGAGGKPGDGSPPRTSESESVAAITSTSSA